MSTKLKSCSKSAFVKLNSDCDCNRMRYNTKVMIFGPWFELGVRKMNSKISGRSFLVL